MYMNVRWAFVVLVSLIFAIESAAAPVIVFGPQTLKSSVSGKDYNLTFQGPAGIPSGKSLDGVITIQNGNGQNIVIEKCSGSLLQRVLCMASNLLKEAKIFVDRPLESEVTLNGVVILARNELNRGTGILQKAVKVKSANTLKVRLKGLPTSDMTLSIKSESQAVNVPPVAAFSYSPTAGAIAPQVISFSALASSDSDGTITSYSWNFGDGTFGTGALVDHLFSTAGNYTVALTVTDNQGGTNTKTISVNVLANQLPVAAFTANSVTSSGELKLVFDASASSDADGSLVDYKWDFGDGVVLSTGLIKTTEHIYATTGTYKVTLTVVDNKSGENSVFQNLIVADSTGPALTISSPMEGTVIESQSLSVSGSANEKLSAASAQIDDGPAVGLSLSSDGMSFSGSIAVAGSGNKVLTVKALDIAGNESVSKVNFSSVFNLPPVAKIKSVFPTSGQAPLIVLIDGSESSDPEGQALNYEFDFGDGEKVSSNKSIISHYYKRAGSYSIQLTVKDSKGLSHSVSSSVTASDPLLPPDPSGLAPLASKTNLSTIEDSFKFLFESSTPIQKDVTSGSIDPLRMTVLRGKVLDQEGLPLPGVEISIHLQNQFGKTLSRNDGYFDFALNGGGTYTVDYKRSGYFPLQRTITTSIQEISVLEDVVLTRPDPIVNNLEINSSVMQIAKSSEVSDSKGTRTGVALIPSGTSANIVFPNGSKSALTSLNLRVTEYTVGELGPQRMPGLLPATSAYTFAADISADEGLARGADHLEFSKKVSFYVDNFLNFPVGVAVPFGVYETRTAQWVPQDNGRIIKILEVQNQKAVLDVNGTGSEASSAELALLGITDEELTKLAEVYTSGKTLWRVTSNRFSPCDLNWFSRVLGTSDFPSVPAPSLQSTPPPYEMTCPKNGSIIDVEKQVLRENIPVVGADFYLTYSSERTSGYTSNSRIVIPLTGNTVGSSMVGVKVEVQIAGRSFVTRFPAQTNQNYSFDWDGKDVYGRDVYGSSKAKVLVTYLYDSVYAISGSTQGRVFAMPGGGDVVTSISSEPTELRRQYEVPVMRNRTFSNQSLGGWFVSIHKNYDPTTRTLYHGDGTSESSQDIGFVVDRYAGTGSMLVYGGDNGPALDAQYYYIGGIARFSDGSLLVADQAGGASGQTILRKVTSNRDNNIYYGGFNNFGSGGQGSQAEGIDKDQAAINATSIKIAPNDEIYYVDNSGGLNARVRKINLEGKVNTVVGKYFAGGYTGDGGPATEALLNNPRDVAIDKDGTMYIADTGNQRIRRVGTDGTITTIAGNGTRGFGGDGGLAVNAQFNDPVYVAIGKKNGYIYVADQNNYRIRAIRPDGIIETVAGNGEGIGLANLVDGVIATLTAIKPFCVETANDGTFFICDGYARIRKVDRQGIISTLIGNGNASGATNFNQGFEQEGILASQAKINGAGGNFKANIIVADSEVYFAQSSNNISERFSGYHKIRRVAPAFPGQTLSQISIPSKDGQQTHIFDYRGRHLETKNSRTGISLYKFEYDSEGRLEKITDVDGMITQIARDGSGNPVSITAPHGQVTQIDVDSNGNIASLNNPNSENYKMTYDSSGLLKTFARPKGNASTFSYDVAGNLIKDQNAAGGFLTLVKASAFRDQVVTMTTAESRVSSNRTITSVDPSFRIIETDSAGLQTQRLKDKKGTTSIFNPDGSSVAFQEVANPRLGITAPYIGSHITTMPSALKSTTQVVRSLTRTNASNIFDFAELINISTNGKLTKVEYDSLTRVEKTTSAEGRVIQKLYDVKGRNIASQVGSLTQQNMIYNTAGQLVQTTHGPRSTTLAYDSQGYLASVTNPLSQKSEFTYDGSGRVSTQKLPDGRVIGFNYDANGNMTSITPPGRPAHEFSFNLVDMVNSYQAPDVGILRTTSYTYNLDKQLTSITRPDGKVATLSYNSTTGRLSSMTTPLGNFTYSYSPTTGQVSSITSPEGVVSAMTYDGSLVKSVSTSGAATGSVQFNYNSDFLISQTQVNGANAVAFSYTNDNLLNSAGAMSLSYDSINPLLSGTSLGIVSDSLGYNNFGEINSYAAKISGSDVYSLSLTRDDLGRITGRTENIQGATANYIYAYDSVGRLSSVDKDGEISAYTFDPNSNRIGNVVRNVPISATYDNQDRLLKYGTKSYSYNANGDLASVTDSVTRRTATFGYDVMGNLKTYSRIGRNIEYVIDGMNRRVGKKMSGTLRQQFVYQNQLQIAAELDGTGVLVSRFVYASKANVPDYMIKGATTYRIFSDNLGSPRLVVDVSSGAVAQRIDYDEFGVILADTNPGFIPFGFAGGIMDLDTGLVRFGARDYDPETGRWVTKDPIGFAGGDTNLYSYSLQDPVNLIDPSGLKLNFDQGLSQNLAQIWSTPAGNALITQLMGSNQTYKLTVNSSGNHYQQGNMVTIDPGNHPFVYTSNGIEPASTTRILAHEMGHLTGTLDDGINNMNNVNLYENPIMQQLGGHRRTSYTIPGGGLCGR